MKPQKQLIATSVLLTGLALSGLAIAQTPYWDNSSGNQSFYTPPASGSQQNYNSAPQGNYAPPSGYGSGSGYGQGQGQGYYQQSPQSLQGYVGTAPVGTSMSVTNSQLISSETAHTGDPVSFTLSNDLAMGGNVILPAGTSVQGTVSSAVSAGRTLRPGELQLRFNRAVLPDGRSYPLSARLVTPDGTGVIKGGTGAHRAGSAVKNLAGGTAIGAIGGTALGAIFGGHGGWSRGLLMGSAVGAGGGAVHAGIEKGTEAQIQPGTELKIMLDQPLNVSSSGQGY